MVLGDFALGKPAFKAAPVIWVAGAIVVFWTVTAWLVYVTVNDRVEMHTPQFFGAVAGDGLDDSAAFSEAQATWNYVRVPAGEYLLSKPIEILDGARWNFDGVTLAIGGQPALVAHDSKNWSISGDLVIKGAGETSVAVQIQNPRNARIDRIEIEGVAGTALSVSGERQELPRSNTLAIDRLILRRNARGLFVQAGAGAEFVTIQKIEALGNGLAVQVGAGNFQLMGGNIVDNTNGILLTGEGLNNGHGIIRGVTVAHSSGFNLRADGLTHGYTIDASHVYGGEGTGEIELKNSTGVTISNGVIDAKIEVEGPGRNSVTGNFIGGRYFSAPISGALLLYGNFG